MKATHQVRIPSPLGYMGEIEDKRQKGKVTYSMEMFWKLVLMGISAGKKNVPAINQWLEDNAESLYEQGFRTLKGEKRLPSEVSLYRFFWTVEGEIKSLEQKLKRWAIDVCNVLGKKGKLLVFSVDGKHLKGTKRERSGEKAIQLVSIYIQNLCLLYTSPSPRD